MRILSSYRYSLLGAASCAILALAACGGISDPSKNGASDSDGTVATVSGALTGDDVPAGAHVAVVWRVGNEGTLAVGSDAVVTDGAFTINLSTPPDNYFFDPNDNEIDSISGSAPPPDTTDSYGGDGYDPVANPPVIADAGVPTTDTSGGTKESPAVGARLRPLDGLSGTVSKPMRVAVAGFVVYLDTNGNGKLDISGKYGESTDEIIGGNDELALAFLRDGTPLAYEKLRDKAGQLPAAGYNLVWLDDNRWLPLNAVDLELSAKQAKLPSGVCAQGSEGISGGAPIVSGSSGGGGTLPPYEESTDGPAVSNDPNINCSYDGRSYYTVNCPEATPTGLCGYMANYEPCAYGVGESLAAGVDIPADWPCHIISAADAGAPPPVVFDASVP